MKTKTIIRAFFFLLLFSHNTVAFSQDNDDDSIPSPVKPKKHLLTGFYVGSYFANKYSANNYSGYGFDIDGHRNVFSNSLINQKINNEYGLGATNFGQPDLIAQALGVDQGRWHFTESDMPVNMHYRPAVLVGFNFNIPVSRKGSIIANINGTKLEIDGNFTITTDLLNSPNPAVNTNIRTCTIIGKEQRLIFQLGYQRILGDDDKLNFFVEGGLLGTLDKFDKDMVYINTLAIDLTFYNTQSANLSSPFKRPVGFAFGGFGSFGIDIEANPKITVQLLYTLSAEKINIGIDPKLKPQNGIGLRAYYNF